MKRYGKKQASKEEAGAAAGSTEAAITPELREKQNRKAGSSTQRISN